MVVMKFGGTSMGSVASMRMALKAVIEKSNIHAKSYIVVSALGGITSLLLETAVLASHRDENYKMLCKKIQEKHFSLVHALFPEKQNTAVHGFLEAQFKDLEDILHGVYLVRELTPRASDYIVSYGERLCARIFSELAKVEGLDMYYVDMRPLIKTDSNFGNAKVQVTETLATIKEYFKDKTGVAIATGFIGSDMTGKTTTLGRGGSDYTAAILANALVADSLEIWTDVDGVMTCDPRVVKEAYPLEEMSYQEAMELSHFGAKVIYPPTLQPVFSKNIPVWVKNTFNQTFAGTKIHAASEMNASRPVKGISSIQSVAVLNIQGSGMIGVTGTSSRIFDALGKAGVNVILITQASSEHSICLATLPHHAEDAKSAIESAFHYEIKDGKLDPVNIESDLSVVALVGDNMRNVPGIAGRMFSSLGRNGINIRAIAQGSSERNISVVIKQHQTAKALNVLHDAFFLGDRQNLNLFVVGHGLVGRELFRQLAGQYNYFLKERRLKLNLVGISNRRKMLIKEDGIPMEQWESLLENSETSTDLDAFVSTMIRLNLPNSVFVDNTSDKNIVRFYADALDASIHVVTPNKIATSESFQQYDRLRKSAQDRGVQFLFETNVGAGLPVISTLRDLMQSGDRIVSIEGVLSGTMSYIFNRYDGTTSFANIVREAQEKGFTEPDPREDLSLMDVKRKILILARESGATLEMEDVEVEPLLSDECLRADGLPAFYEALQKDETAFSTLYRKAAGEAKKLRLVAQYKDGKAKVGLQMFSADHALYGLTGSDNMIAFTTLRYSEQPLVIRGPGAGAAVTATGVFADIIRTSKR